MVDEKSETPFDSIVIAAKDADTGVPDGEPPDIEIPGHEPPEKELPPRVRSEKKLGSWARWSLIVIVLLCLTYILAGYALVPYLFTSLLPHRLAVSTERPVTVGSAEFSPFTGILILRNVIIGPRLTDPEDTVDPVLSFSRCLIDLEASSLVRRGLICKEFTLDRFFLHLVRRPDSTYNITELLPPALSENNGRNTADNEGLLAGLPFFSLNNINVSDSRILFNDQPAGKKHTVDEMSLALPTIGNFPYQVTEYIRPEFSARINGSTVTILGQTEITAAGINTSLQLQMESVDLPAYLAYLPADSGFGLAGGTGDFSMELVFSTGKPPEERLQLEGSAKLVDLRIQDSQGLNRMTLPDLRVEGVVYPMGNRYHLREFFCKGPEINIERNAEGNTKLPGFLAGFWDDSALARTDEKKLNIERLMVEGGRFVFVDRTVAGGFVDSWSDIMVTANNLSNDSSVSDRSSPFEFSARRDSKSTARSGSLQGQGMVFASPPRINGNFQVADLPLVRYQPYLDTIILGGNRIKKGQADIAGRFLLDYGNGGRQQGFIIEEATAAIEDLVLTAADHEWFQAASFVCSKASFGSGDRVLDLGRVKIEGGKVELGYNPEGQVLLPSGKASGNEEKTVRKVRLDVQVAEEWQNNLKSLGMNNFIVNFVGSGVASKGLNGNGHAPGPWQSFSLRLDEMILLLDDLPGQEKGQWRKKATGSATINGQGQIEWTGFMSGPSFGAELDCTLKEMELDGLAPLFQQWLRPELKLTGTILQAVGVLRMPVVSFSGTAEITDFSAAADGQSIFSWKNAVARDLSFAPWTALQIGRLDVDEPALTWKIDQKGMSNLRNVFVKGPISDTGQAEPARFEIGTLGFTQGVLAITDRNVMPPYRAKISGGGTISALVNRPDKHAGISVTGSLNTGAELGLSGRFGLFEPEFFGDYQLQVDELELSPLSSYIESQLGTAITGGKLAAAIQYRQEKGRFVANNHLEVSDIVLGERKQEHTNTALTVALLQQPDGLMVFDIPASGNVADPNFSLRTAIVKKLRSLQVKAAVSPFLLVDDILQDTNLPVAERRQLSHLSFTAGMMDFSRSGKEKLAALAHLLRERPWLTLKIQGYADARNDRAAMVAVLEKNARYKQVVEDIRKSEEISKAYGREEIPPPEPLASLGKSQGMARKKKKSITVDDAELLELAHERSMVVQLYLIEELKIEERRLSVGERQLILGETVGRPGNRVEFTVGSSLGRKGGGEH